MQRTLATLQNECKKLEIQPTRFTGPGGKPAKRDYVNTLGDHFSSLLYPQGEPWGLVERRKIESPMLAFLFQHLKDQEQKEIFDSPHWVFEEKIDGCRMVLFYDGLGGKWAFSRNISVKNYLPVEYTDKVKFPVLPNPGIPCILDCEIQCTSTSIREELANRGIEADTQLDATNSVLSLNTKESLELQENHPLKLHVFDILKYNDRSLVNQPWGKRRIALEKIVPDTCHTELFSKVKVVSKDRMKYLKSIWESDGEGVIAKNIHSKYTPTNSRGRARFVKIKRKVSSTLGTFESGDFTDAFVSGSTPGKSGSAWENLVGSLDLSVNLILNDGSEVEHVIARVSNIPMEMRKEITTHENGIPALKPEYLGRVFEVDGQDVSAKARRFSHAVIVRPRPDRSQFECVMNESELDNMIM